MELLKGIIDRFEGEKAVIVFADGQKLIVDKKMLAPDSKEGDAANLNILPSAGETAAKEALAKSMLEELLKKQTNV